MQLTFDQLPAAVLGLYTKLENIERLLQLQHEPQVQTERWYDLNELCDYLPDAPAKATVYGWVSNGDIPNHKRGKKLYFLKSEIDLWLHAGRRKTTTEIEAEADTFLSNNKRRSRN